jgi:hypothetical protein
MDIEEVKKFLLEHDEFICDEYRSYLEWLIRENKSFSLESKEAYMHGYSAGYSYRKYAQSQEQLQK